MRCGVVVLAVLVCGASAVPTTQECSTWETSLTDGTLLMEDGTTWKDEFEKCFTTSLTWSEGYFYTDGSGTGCTDRCHEVYDRVKELAEDADRLDCWQSRYYGGPQKIYCLKDQNGNSCGGMTGIYAALEKIYNLYENNTEAVETWIGQQFPDNTETPYDPPFAADSGLPAELAGACDSTCLPESLQMMMEFNSEVPNSGDSLLNYYSYLTGWEAYVCQKHDGDYIFKDGIEAQANIMMASFSAKVPELDKFCEVDEDTGFSNGRRSSAKMMTIYDTIPGISAELVEKIVEGWESTMDFMCMTSGTGDDEQYCAQAFGGSDESPCDDVDDPNTDMTEGCKQWIKTNIPAAGCCTKAFSDLNDKMSAMSDDEEDLAETGFVKIFVDKAGLSYDDLPPACNAGEYEVDVTFYFEDLTDDEIETLIDMFIQDVAAYLGVSKDRISAALISNKNGGKTLTVSQPSLKDAQTVGVGDTDPDMTRLKQSLAKQGKSLGNVTMTTDSNVRRAPDATPTTSGASHSSGMVMLAITAITAWVVVRV